MGFLSDNFISQFLVSVLNFVVGVVNDYSLAIIVATLLIRFVLMPLDLKQRKSSRAMTLITPEVESLKKRYANNPDQLNRKVQDLYKQNNIKPLAGCLPMLIQLPLLFAFFGALRVIASEQTMGFVLDAVTNGADSVVLPQWLWVHNFWQPDSGFAGIMPTAQELLTFAQTNASYISPQALMMLKTQGILNFSGSALAINTQAYESIVTAVSQANGLVGIANGWFGLPLIAGVSLFFQQRLMSKSQPQQMNNKMMTYFFPLFSVYICATSNTAFSVYWVATNVYSLAMYLVQDTYYKHKDKGLGNTGMLRTE